MDDTLRFLQSLYGENGDAPDVARRLAEDDAFRDECEQLRQTKEALDRRSSPSPDPAVVDRVVDQAATAARESTATDTPPSQSASDRPARTPPRMPSRRLQGASAAVAVALLLGLGWWHLGPGESAAPGPAANESTPQQTETAAQAQSEEMPEWDGREEVVRLHQRVETLRSRSRSDTWGTDLQTVDR